MKHRIPKVLYFSLDDARVSWFWTWINTGRYNYSKSAVFTQSESKGAFRHAVDLSLYLNQYGSNLQSLHVIIDLASLNEPAQIDILRDTIIEFPEVQFIFDKKHDSTDDLLSVLFPQEELDDYIDSFTDQEKKQIQQTWARIANGIDVSILELCLDDPDYEYEPTDKFARIINGIDNTFDASNLRYAIKYRKYLHLKVHHNRNFLKIQESRFNNLAICVEEEVRQNIFNSYALYVNGFRVLPITTREELRITNAKLNNCTSREGLLCSEHSSRLFHSLDGHKPVEGIIVRDYDLQFEDENQQPVDEIRGFRYCEAEDLIKGSSFSDQVGKFLKDYHLGWNDLRINYNEKPNSYWHSLSQSGFPMYFITKGPRKSKMVHPEKSGTVCFSKDKTRMFLPGFEKPVCGLYSPFQSLPKVWSTYDNTRYSEEKDGPNYEIKTSRKEHDHSTPLDIYDMANNMIRRAESYYNDKRFILAALVSGEALEFLNGFHHRLTIKAYYILAIAENAIAMDVVGGNERYLAKDASFRVLKIIEDVNRFYYGYEEKSSRNVLNQIFSTCRQFCKEHDHFESEEVFLSAMGHLLEGFSFSTIRRRIIRRLTSKKDL